MQWSVASSDGETAQLFHYYRDADAVKTFDQEIVSLPTRRMQLFDQGNILSVRLVCACAKAAALNCC